MSDEILQQECDECIDPETYDPKLLREWKKCWRHAPKDTTGSEDAVVTVQSGFASDNESGLATNRAFSRWLKKGDKKARERWKSSGATIKKGR